MECKNFIVLLLLLVLTISVSSEETTADDTPQEIYPRQDSPLKGVGQKLQVGAQNLIKGVQHFVVGVLGAINNVNIQNEIGDAFQASAETTTPEYYDEETTTTPQSTSTTAQKRLKSTTTPVVGQSSTVAAAEVPVESTTLRGYKIRKPNIKITTKSPEIIKTNQSPYIQVIPQYQYPQYQGQYLPPYQQPIIPGYAPQYHPLYPAYQQQQVLAQQPIKTQQLLSPSNPNIPVPNTQTLNQLLNPASVQSQSQVVSHPLHVILSQPLQKVDESISQNEQPLKSSNVPQPHISEIIEITVHPPPAVQQEQKEPQIVTNSQVTVQPIVPVTLPALLFEQTSQASSSTIKPLNRLVLFSLNRKPSISLLTLKPTIIMHKDVPIPLGTVVRPNEPKYPIKSSNFVRTLKPQVRPQRPVVVAAQQPQPPAPAFPSPPNRPVVEEIVVSTTTTDEEVTEEKEVTEETDVSVDPEVDSVIDDTKEGPNKN